MTPNLSHCGTQFTRVANGEQATQYTNAERDLAQREQTRSVSEAMAQHKHHNE